MKGALFAYARLFRIEHALMLVAAVLFSEILASHSLAVPLPPLHVLLLSLAVPLFIEMGSFALNDWFDVGTDRENRRGDRPIAGGEIPAGAALAASAACYALGIAAAVLLPPLALLIALAFAALSILYNWKLKDIALLGNSYIAASMAVPFLFGNLVVSPWLHLPLLAIADVAFAAGLGREIIKSVEDVGGDTKHRKSRTLPALVGRQNAIFGAQACYAILAPLSFLPFALGLPMNTLSLGLVSLGALSFLSMALQLGKKQETGELEKSRKASLFALAVGLAGYAAALI